MRTTYHSYKAVCEELDRRRRIALGFERIEALLELLGDPHRSLRVVQVVGTNGKGATAVALANTLEAAGQPCGAYLSPHVLSYTERFLLHGRFISEEEFAAVMGTVMQIADSNGVPATQFELLTAGALLMFRDAGLPWAVLEAGLGARHDATSAAGAEAVVLTNVSLDHTEYLGGTVEEIAGEKLASLRKGATLILGTNDPRVVRLAQETAQKLGASLVYKTAIRGSEATYLERNERLGERAAEVLLGRPLRRDEREAQTTSLLPARFEVHEVRGAPVVVDGGHNPEGLRAALGAVRAKFGERPLGVVFGALKEKDVASMLGTLEREAYALVLTRPAETGGRALEPEWLEKEYGPRDAGGRKARVIDDAYEALLRAAGEMEEVGGVVLVTGSLSTGAAVLGRLRREE